MNTRIKNVPDKDKQAKNYPTTLIIKKERCPQNHICPSLAVCPVGALSQDGFNAPTVDSEKCIRCGKCIKFCPMKVFALIEN